MKTTLDLPEPLITEVKIRAAKEKRRMKDIIAEALERGLRHTTLPQKPSSNRPLQPLFSAPFPKNLTDVNFNHSAADWDDEATIDELAE